MAKLGKGYRDDGKPQGVISGICEECGGDIIALQMCTSKRGFSVSSEKVCQDCGLLAPQAFILDHPVIDKPPKIDLLYQQREREQDYKSKYWYEIILPYEDFKKHIRYTPKTIMCKASYHTYRINEGLKGNIYKEEALEIDHEYLYYDNHEIWKHNVDLSGLEAEGIDTLYEYKLQIAGERPGPTTHTSVHESNNNSTGRLKAAMSRESRVGAMRHTPKDIWRELQYKELINDYKYILEMNSIQVEDVEHIIKDHSIMKMDYKAEVIIFNICLYIRLLGMGRKGTGIMNKARLVEYYNKTLYSLIRDKLSS